jgi:polysaccharide biosynthesis/export protein
MKPVIRTGLAALILTLAGWGQVAAQSVATPPVEAGPYLLAPGDVLDIVVWRNRDLTLTATVRPDGWISYPIAGELRAVGLTPAALQRRIEEALAKVVQAPAVTVLVTRIAGFKVSILGRVRQPGHYDVQPSTTVLDVLAMAGGPNDYANPDGMYLLRRSDSGDPERIAVPYSTSVSGRKPSPNFTVRPGDIVVVP